MARTDYSMGTITLDMHAPGTFGAPVIRNDDGRDTLVQADWDYPGVASAFGWDMRLRTFGTPRQNRCAHDGTDGTIPCPRCAAPAGAFVGAAREWLDEHDGTTADDPGYFSED